MPRVGILGGSFNPIHNGHLWLAESSRAHFNLDYVYFIPANRNPYKSDYKLNEDGVNHRYNMLKMAIESNQYFMHSSIELDRSGTTYTIDTVKAIQKEYPNYEYFFIAGADIIFQIHTWKSFKLLLKSVTLVTTMRPGYSNAQFERQILFLEKEYGAKILKFYTSKMEIASSEIRERVSKGETIKYLLPESVENYIYENGLYKDGDLVEDDEMF